MGQHGWRVMTLTNFFAKEDAEYKGLHLTVGYPKDDLVFEIQLHTEQSRELRQENHADYQSRKALKGPAAAELTERMLQRAKKVGAPSNVTLLTTQWARRIVEAAAHSQGIAAQRSAVAPSLPMPPALPIMPAGMQGRPVEIELFDDEGGIRMARGYRIVLEDGEEIDCFTPPNVEGAPYHEAQKDTSCSRHVLNMLNWHLTRDRSLLVSRKGLDVFIKAMYDTAQAKERTTLYEFDDLTSFNRTRPGAPPLRNVPAGLTAEGKLNTFDMCSEAQIDRESALGVVYVSGKPGSHAQHSVMIAQTAQGSFRVYDPQMEAPIALRAQTLSQALKEFIEPYRDNEFGLLLPQTVKQDAGAGDAARQTETRAWMAGGQDDAEERDMSLDSNEASSVASPQTVPPTQAGPVSIKPVRSVTPETALDKAAMRTMIALGKKRARSDTPERQPGAVSAKPAQETAPPPFKQPRTESIGLAAERQQEQELREQVRAWLQRLRNLEPVISEDIRAIVSDAHGQVQGCHFRKEEELQRIWTNWVRRNRRKIDSDAKKDALHYTVTWKDANFVAGVERLVQAMGQRGWQIESIGNFFRDARPEHKGIHLVVRHPGNGAVVEMQMHTELSYRAKEDNKENYLAWRNAADEKTRRQWKHKMELHTHEVANPRGVEEISYRWAVKKINGTRQPLPSSITGQASTSTLQGAAAARQQAPGIQLQDVLRRQRRTGDSPPLHSGAAGSRAGAQTTQGHLAGHISSTTTQQSRRQADRFRERLGTPP